MTTNRSLVRAAAEDTPTTAGDTYLPMERRYGFTTLSAHREAEIRVSAEATEESEVTLGCVPSALWGNCRFDFRCILSGMFFKQAAFGRNQSSRIAYLERTQMLQDE